MLLLQTLGLMSIFQVVTVGAIYALTTAFNVSFFSWESRACAKCAVEIFMLGTSSMPARSELLLKKRCAVVLSIVFCQPELEEHASVSKNASLMLKNLVQQ